MTDSVGELHQRLSVFSNEILMYSNSIRTEKLKAFRDLTRINGKNVVILKHSQFMSLIIKLLREDHDDETLTAILESLENLASLEEALPILAVIQDPDKINGLDMYPLLLPCLQQLIAGRKDGVQLGALKVAVKLSWNTAINDEIREYMCRLGYVPLLMGVIEEYGYIGPQAVEACLTLLRIACGGEPVIEYMLSKRLVECMKVMIRQRELLGYALTTLQNMASKGNGARYLQDESLSLVAVVLEAMRAASRGNKGRALELLRCLSRLEADAEAVSAMMDLITNGSSDEKKKALRILRKVDALKLALAGQSQFVVSIAQLLRDGNERVETQIIVLECLEIIASHEEAFPILAALKDPDYVSENPYKLIVHGSCHTTFPSFRLNVPMTDAKVYYECTIPSDCRITSAETVLSETQIGTVTSNWIPKGTSYGVGDDVYGSGVDGSRACYYHAGAKTDVQGVPDSWKAGTVVGLALDLVTKSIKATFDGAEVKTVSPLSLASAGDIFIPAFTITWSKNAEAGTTMDFNFGQRNLKHKPEEFVSVAEYANGGQPRHFEMYDMANKMWEKYIPENERDQSLLVLPCLQKLISGRNGNIKLGVLNVVVNMAMNDEIREYMCRVGYVPLLIGVIAEYGYKGPQAKAACWTLRSIAFGGESVIEYMLSKELVECMKAVIREEALLGYALMTLQTVAFQANGKRYLQDEAQSLVLVILEAMKKASRDNKVQALQLLDKLSSLNPDSECLSVAMDLITNGTKTEKENIGHIVSNSLIDRGSVVGLEAWLAIGLDVNTTVQYNISASYYSASLLSIACHCKKEDIALLLIERGADVCSQCLRSAIVWTLPIHDACKNMLSRVVRGLIEKGVGVNVSCSQGDSPLQYLLHSWKRSEGLDLVKYLLLMRAEVNHKGQSGRTPLIRYAWNESEEDYELVNTLLENGADINAKDSEYGRTALTFAGLSKRYVVCMALIDRGADVNVIDKYGNGFLDEASADIKAMLSVCTLSLSELQANSYDKWFRLVQQCNGSTADPSTVKVISLLKNNPELLIVESIDGQKTVLYYALEKKIWSLVDTLLSLGADLGQADSDSYKLLEPVMNERDRLLAWLKIIVEGESSGESSVFIRLLLRYDNHSLWLSLMEVNEESKLIKFIVIRFQYLASVKDRNGRKAIEIATVANREAINSVLLWHGRFRVIEKGPEHESETCFVFKAVDELVDEDGNNRKVALKLIRIKDHFEREIAARTANFSPDAVISIILTIPAPGLPDSVSVTVESGQFLSKAQAESMYCIVLPLADRNLFMALKHERFAGLKWDVIAHIFKQLATAADHMHSKNIVHGDIKPLNIVRRDSAYLFIDLDASCEIGRDAIGSKFSSAFIPPEAVYVDDVNNVAAVKSKHHREAHGLNYDLLIADPSFDVWSLGCILFQMCTKALSLFEANNDDNMKDDPDSLFVLFKWTDETKSGKLDEVANPEARNLISQLLTKDPKKRPPLSRVLMHPFLTGKPVVRKIGEEAAFQVFISYRVWSDSENAQFLFDELTKRDIKVWWDAKCLKDGESWEEGFCRGLVNSSVFVCILSKKALAKFASLVQTAKCDNVLLEHRLALELLEMGLLSNVFPIVMGEPVSPDPKLSPKDTIYAIDWTTIFPAAPDLYVDAVEASVKHHLSNQALGTPMQPKKTVSSVLNDISKMQGALIEKGTWEERMLSAVDRIVKLCQGVGAGTGVSSSYVSTTSIDLSSEVARLEKLLAAKDQQLTVKKQELEAKEQELATKDQELAVQDQVLAARLETSTLTEVRRLRSEIAQKDRKIAQKDQELVAKDQELFMLRS